MAEIKGRGVSGANNNRWLLQTLIVSRYFLFSCSA
jgi:hypothetical protein